MENLWGQIDTSKIDTPKSILEEQAKYLSDATRKNVFADVERNLLTEKKNEDENLVYDFIIRGKHVENFGYKLFSIEHPIDLYPVKIQLDKKTFEEIERLIKEYSSLPILSYVTVDCKEDYIDVLRYILTSKRVKNLITGVLSLSSRENNIF